MNLSNVKSSIRMFGGKFWIAKHLIKRFPDNYDIFVDLFGGGAHVITQKAKTSRLEVYNDKDNDLVNFLLIMASDQRESLKQRLQLLPASRYLFEKWQDEWFQGIRPESDLERAVRYYYIQRFKIVPHPNQKSGFRYSKTRDTAADYHNSIGNLDSFATRFREIIVENKDYNEIIKMYDSNSTFFYIDSPYLGKEHYYTGNFTKNDHLLLAQKLNTIQGKAMVSYYGDPLILELYSSWRYETIEAAVGGVVKKELGEQRNWKTEYIFMNYEHQECQLEGQLTMW